MYQFVLIVLTALTLAASRAVEAQRSLPPGLSAALPLAGTRVRVSAAQRDQAVGTVVGYRSDTLVLRPEGATYELTFALGSILGIDESVERHTNVRKGALIGFASGAAFGALLNATLPDTGSSFPFTPHEASMIVAGACAVVGLVVGALVGGHEFEHWEPMALPRSTHLRLRALPDRSGVSVALVLSR